jgi:hypothetical protein
MTIGQTAPLPALRGLDAFQQLPATSASFGEVLDTTVATWH